jgi:hypothetical protein
LSISAAPVRVASARPTVYLPDAGVAEQIDDASREAQSNRTRGHAAQGYGRGAGTVLRASVAKEGQHRREVTLEEDAERFGAGARLDQKLRVRRRCFANSARRSSGGGLACVAE